MCGIVGYIGKKNNCLNYLINGLKKLEYRGYDSAGIAYYDNNDNINIIKTVGRISELEKKVDYDKESSIGIGHTRWATHGGCTTINAHPHKEGVITIVHNGIIENYDKLKAILIKKGYSFKSETDTEVAAAYIDYLYKKDNDILSVMNECMKDFIGSYAILIMIDNDKNIYVMKKDSPMIIGYGEYNNYIASSLNAFDDNVNEYIILEDYDYGYINEDEVKIFNNKELQSRDTYKFDINTDIGSKNGYSHFMLKEINEQKDIIEKLNNIYLDKLDDLIDISKYDNIHIIACGSAYHAGMVAKYIMEENTNINVSVYVASEYRYQKINYINNTLVIAISQSGETADTIACVKKAKSKGIYTLSIVNVVDSTIARLTDKVIYTEAGAEIAVATTKGYLTQVYILTLLVLRNLSNREEIIKDYYKLPNIIERLINIDYGKISDYISNYNNVFYLGRNIDYASMLEGALKLKEISYIHAECYAAGELKHGTISLIEKNTPVIVLITKNDIALKSISNVIEVLSRGAHITLIIKSNLVNNINDDNYDDLIVVDDINEMLLPIISIIPLQVIAFEVALKRGCDIDKPRNLAKSVTVE